MTRERPRWYILVEKTAVPATSIEEAARQFEDIDRRRVAETIIGPRRVSTVFLSIDHAWEGPPILFETMIFSDDEARYCTRCSTWAEAEAMHAIAVAFAQKLLVH